MTLDGTDESWEQRRLCVDENCIGVLGPDGRCKECGKPGGEPVPARSAPPEAAPAVAVSPGGEAPPALSAASAGAGDSWADRRLCSDESCIGVIGPDGRCKECGKPYAG
jgi:hypothetical protein